MIKVGLIVKPSGEWQGGVSYFRNLLSCYRKHPDPEVKLALFSSKPESLAQFRCDAIEVNFWPGTPKSPLWSLPQRAIRRSVGIDPILTGILKRHRVDLLSHPWADDLDSLGRRADMPALLWMPDFQHKRLPHFFTEQDCAYRDSLVARSWQYGNLLLSSRAAERDFRQFYPELSAVRTHILRFACASAVDLVPLSREELESHYAIREPYFFLPNQFWQHKNHTVVVDALRQTPPEIRVICTGLMSDPRSPGYVPDLMEKVKNSGLENRFVCLGKVPFPVLVSLMHYSIAVLQPSLFEGWSTTIEESKAMCKRIILSNIDVHLEQAPERGLYFSPDSSYQLAEHLKRAYAEFDPRTEERFAMQRQQFKARTDGKWVAEYARILRMVCEERPIMSEGNHSWQKSH